MLEHLLSHWFPLAALVVGIALLGCFARWRSWSLLLIGSALTLFGLGGVAFLPDDVGMFVAITAISLLTAQLLLLIASGRWWATAGWLLGAALCFGVGAWAGPHASEPLASAGAFLLTLRPLEPWWLLILLAIPLVITMSWRNLASLGAGRRAFTLIFRCSLIAFLSLALAETHARKPEKSVTVLFVWDRSMSIPPEFVDGVDTREERIRNFINQAVKDRGADHATDRSGVIVFGRQPRLELPPSSVDKLGFKKILSQLDDTYTDIASAIKLSLASFPEGAGKRIVLVSDGNENLGGAEEQARIARQNGVQIDVVPVASSRRSQNEVLVERIEAPSQTEKDARLPLRVVLRSFHPQVVAGSLQIRKVGLELRKNPNDKTDTPVFDANIVVNSKVKLRTGLNVFYYQQPGSKQEEATTYEANFVPSHVETAAGVKVHDGLKGDRVENNRASVSVMARGQRAVLLVESETEAGQHKLLTERLQAAKGGLKVVQITSSRLPQDPEQLAVVLNKFDAVILANVPADEISEEQQKVIRANTHDQGAGLVMIGGNQSFGAGGWQNTEIEKALPVTMELKSTKVEGKSGLSLIMHASEMADGNAWQRKIARLAIEKMSPMDMLGLLHYDHTSGRHEWHLPVQEIGQKRKALIAKLNNMEPGDMPDVDPAFAKSYVELTKPAYQLGTKHIILISDGDHWDASNAMLQKLKSAKITVTTVCITTHGQNEIKKMAAVAQICGGRSYHITDPNQLPAIYIKETRLISKSFVHEGAFKPNLLIRGGPTEGLVGPLPDLHGFVRSTKRQSTLVEMPIETPLIGAGDTRYPILAHWQYGLGRSAAFTSDARTLAGGRAFWDRDWANSNVYAQFWEQTIDWILRPTDTGKFLQMATEQRDGKIRVTIEAAELDKTPLTEVEFKAGISSPSFKGPDGRKVDLKFEQKNSGVYEAEFSADEVGSYFINIQAKWKKDGKEFADQVRGAVTIPYSPEFAEMESNPALLEKLREITGGMRYDDSDEALKRVAKSGEVFRPVPQSQPTLQALWPWFVLLTALCLLFDVAVRRVAVPLEAVTAQAQAVWLKLRGTPQEPKPAEFLERLRSRKAAVGESLDKEKTARKFDAPEGAPSNAPMSGVPSATAPPSPKSPPPAPAKKEEVLDFATRLKRAKEQARKDIEKKEKPKE
jgi:uncharacterized membrane protein